MKLFEFVPCGRRPAEAAPPPPPPAVEEAAEKRRRRSSGSGAPAWKPTLVAISEDAALTAAAAAAAAKGKAKAKAPPGSSAAAARIPARTDYDDFRNYGVPTVMPVFAPSAFLF